MMKIHFALLALAVIAAVALAEENVVEDERVELPTWKEFDLADITDEDIKLEMTPYACISWMCKLACRVSQKRKGSCVEDECICRNKIR